MRSDRHPSAAKLGEEPEKQAQAHTEEQASDDGKVKGGVFAAVDDVAGEAAEAEGELGAEVKNSAGKDQESAEEKERATEFAKRVHSTILSQAADKSFGGRLRPIILPLNI
jgi:hypothetical protein